MMGLSAYGQDLKLKRGQYCFGDAVAVGNNGFYMGLSLGNDFNSGTDIKIFRFDWNLNPIDSILLSDVLGADGSFRHIERIQIDEQGTVWANVLRRNTQPCLYNRSYMVHLTADLQWIHGFDLAQPSDSGGVYVSDFAIEDSSVVVVGSSSALECVPMINGMIRRYSQTGTLLKAKNSPPREYFDIEKMGNEYWVIGKIFPVPFTQKQVFNSQLNGIDSNAFFWELYRSMIL
ncbi:hypothetical protein GC167_10415 [bacterium]|nr:hypothetical protein [bacterium]